MLAREIMSEHLITVGENATVTEASSLLVEHAITAAPVSTPIDASSAS